MTLTGRIIPIFFALLTYKTAWAQQGLPRVVVKDRSNGTPIENVHVFDAASSAGWVSDENGIIALDRIVLPKEFVISHIAYAEKRIEIRANGFGPDGSLEIWLDPRSVMLDPVQITGPGPQVVHQHADLHVGAYHVNSDGVWVLVYEKKQLWHREENAGAQAFRGARLHLLDAGLQQIASVDLPVDVKEMLHDHLQRPIVVTHDRAYLVAWIDDRIDLEPTSRKELENAILPWKAAIGGTLIGSDQQRTYPAFNYFAFDTASKESRPICEVEEKHTMQLFRSQYKYMSGRDKVLAMDMELETGIDREIIAGYMTGFQRDPYYREPYAPLFVVNDTICIFDHTIHRIRRFDRSLKPIDDVPITYQDQRSWRSRSIQDPITERIYSIHQRNDRFWLNEIDPNTGAIKSSSTLHHPFPEEVQVYDGYVWYVYRPFGSLQKRTLYRELLAGSIPPGS